jgi:hypothetical protein
MKKMYIAVLDEVPDFMVPTLVAHSVINAHLYFADIDKISEPWFDDYQDWLENSYKKVTVRVNRKEFEKIEESGIPVWLGHENTTLNAEKSCAVVLPLEDADRPNVLKFAKTWTPNAA